LSWRGSGSKFDPAEFNVPPTLGKGTSQRLQLYIQSAHSRALDILAHSGHFPWGKDTDVARWCIQFGLQYADTIDPGVINSVMREANIINAQNDEAVRKMNFLRDIDKTQQVIMEYRGMGELDLAKDHVNRIWKEIQLMPDEPAREGMWKKKYLDKFEGLFKDLIEYSE
jgi:hypothetical protein